MSRPSHGPGVQYVEPNDPYKFEGGPFAWPAFNELNPHSLNYYFKHVNDWKEALPFCKKKRVAIQAGGSVGLWAKGMAAEFETVYTYEPHPDLFQCLVRNVPERNVIKTQGALGCRRGTVDLGYNSFGSHTVRDPEMVKGVFPISAIDDLCLFDFVDLIQLDLEGYELFALRGAESTIRRCRPVLMIEDVGAETRHDLYVGDTDGYIRHILGYVRHAKVGDDWIYLPKEREGEA